MQRPRIFCSGKINNDGKMAQWRLKRGWSVEDALTKPPDMNPNRVMVTRGKTEVVTFDTKRGDKI